MGRGEGGFTLLEVTVAAAIFVLLIAAFLAITNSTLAAYTEQRARNTLDVTGSAALLEIQRLLRQAGQATSNEGGGGPRTYPFYFFDGTAPGYFNRFAHPPITHKAPAGSTEHLLPSREIVFLAPRDRDMDGYPTAAGVGTTEWDNTDRAITLETGADGVNRLLYRRISLDGTSNVFTVLARDVERVVFDDSSTDPTLGPNGIRIRIYLLAFDPRGTTDAQGRYALQTIEVLKDSIVTMRNVRQPL